MLIVGTNPIPAFFLSLAQTKVKDGAHNFFAHKSLGRTNDLTLLGTYPNATTHRSLFKGALSQPTGHIPRFRRRLPYKEMGFLYPAHTHPATTPSHALISRNSRQLLHRGAYPLMTEPTHNSPCVKLANKLHAPSSQRTEYGPAM